MGFLNIPWWAWGIAALVVSLCYAFFVPKAASIASLSGLHFVIARWFHSLVWLIIAASFFMRGSGREEVIVWANPAALLGGAVYITYLIVFIRLK